MQEKQGKIAQSWLFQPSWHHDARTFSLGLFLRGLVLAGCFFVPFACLVGSGYSLPVWVVMLEGSVPHYSPHFGQTFQGQVLSSLG